MSIRVMTQVWANSQQSGGALLILLAIADFANDDGSAYPSVETLAKKARMSERNAQYVLRKLVDDGELAISKGVGPRGANLYRVLVDRNLPLFDSKYGRCADCGFAPDGPGEIDRHHIIPKARGGTDDPSNLIDLCKRCHQKRHRELGANTSGEKIAPEKSGRGGVKPASSRGATAIAPEPSGTGIEPSGASRAPAKPAPEAPTTTAWNAYCEEMQGAHGIEPPRSAQTNGQLSTLVKRVGAVDAVKLVRYFFAVKNEYYARRGHELGLLLTDCQKLLIGMRRAERGEGAALERWWEDPTKVADRARREGIKPEPGDSYARITARLFIKLGDGPWMNKLDAAVAKHIAEYSAREPA